MPEPNVNSNTTDVAPTVAPVVLQMTAADLQAAIDHGIRQFIASQSQKARGSLLDILSLPFRAASDWACWLRHGDGPDGGKANFGKPAGHKVWPQAQS